MPYTYEQLSNHIEALPEDLKEAIFGEEASAALQQIGKKYSLHIDKLGELVNETGMVMVGLTHPNNFISNLAKRLGIDKETARKIAEDVNQQIFKKVRESLKKIHGITDEKKEPEAPKIEPRTAETTKIPEVARATERKIPEVKITEDKSAPPRKEELRPLEIRPIPSLKKENEPSAVMAPETISVKEQPPKPFPKTEIEPEAKPTPPPDMAFAKESSGLPPETPTTKNAGTEKNEDRKQTETKKRDVYKYDPYREPIE